MKLYELLTESKKQEPAKPRNFVAKNARATTSGAGAHKDKKKAAKQGNIKHKQPFDMNESIQSVDDWKAAVLQAYPQYADKIKFKGRGLQINAEIPGVDRSFGVYDLGSESGEVLHEAATAGATSAGSIATVTSPHLAIGGARGNKSYTGSPGKSGTKAPNPPKTVQKKKADGTAVNALDMSNNIFGGGAVKR